MEARKQLVGIQSAERKNCQLRIISSHIKGYPQEIKIQPKEWKKLFADHISDKGLMSRIKNSYKSATTKQTMQLYKVQKT